MDRREGSNVPMITGLRKADRILYRPFSDYFHVLRDELFRCPTWLIVGYGFRDPHVNQLLTQARDSWCHRKQCQRILIVDYYEFRRAGTQGFEYAWPGIPARKHLAHRIAKTFKADWKVFDGNAALQTLQKSKVNRISRDVAVWLEGAECAFTSNLSDVTHWLL